MKKIVVAGMLALLTLVYPVVCFAESGIDIKIVAGKDKASSSVSASGEVSHIITGKERKTFNIEDHKLKEAWDKYFGKKPNDAWVSSPDHGRDLYEKYGWKEVTTVLRVKRAEILSITSAPTIISTKTLKNSYTKPAKFKASISEQIQDTSTSSWSDTTSIEVKQKFNYGVAVQGETTLDYKHTWGQSGSESKNITVGSEEDITVTLDPGESADVELTASRGTMKVRITYEASLTGTSAANYNPTYKGHHFWDVPITSIMKADNLPTIKEFTEDIDVGYYSNGHVEIKSSQGTLLHSGKVLLKR